MSNRTDIVFLFDVGSPYAWLAAERVECLLGGEITWEPVLLGGLFRLTGRSSWALGDAGRRRTGMSEIERRAREYGLPPLRWPDPWPGDYLFAMRVATHAKHEGAARAFALAAGRAAFTRGVDLSLRDAVLAAAADAGLDPARAAAAAQQSALKAELRETTEAWHARGAFGVPTVVVADRTFWGDDRLESAARACREAGPTAR
jgi:2-hydroxychromene-2-carboxylate isomerase